MPAPFADSRATASDWRDPATTTAATVLLALFWWLAVSASLEKSQTSDELPHIGAGYVYNRFGDFRMQPENGNLPQRLFGLAPLIDGARFPTDETLWRKSTYWLLCWDFLYSEGNPTDWLLLWARALNALFGVALGTLIFGVARSWHGRAGGLLALAFYALAPNFLAHAGLATSDMAATLFLTLAPWLFWRHLRRRDLTSGLLAGLGSGLALVAKHNGVLLAPIYATLMMAHAWIERAPPSGHGATPGKSFIRGMAANFGLGIAQGVAAVAVTWAFYNFRFDARGPGTPDLLQFASPWPDLLARLGTKRELLALAMQWKILPQAWLHGFADVLAGAGGRPAFFAGEHSLHGWWQYFPALFLTKTTLAMLGALALALFVAVQTMHRAPATTRRAWLVHCLPLAISALVVWLAAVTSRINIGDRHILAAYPVLFVGLGVLAARRATLVAVLALWLGHAWASFAIRPHYLAAFNTLVGGPQHAYRLAVDSSLDWGQDLPALQKWLAEHRSASEPFHLGYFGNAWPPHYGVRPTAFLTTTSFVVAPRLTRYELQPGIYALSATVLAEAYSHHRGPWTAEFEQDYRALRVRFAATPRGNPAGDSITAIDYARFDALRLSRLCKYLQRRPPDAFAGYSILIFRLTEEDLRAALDAPVISTHRMRIP